MRAEVFASFAFRASNAFFSSSTRTSRKRRVLRFVAASDAGIQTDGTTAGTVLLSSVQGVSDFTEALGNLYFLGTAGSNSSSLYVTDGTPGGTVAVNPTVDASSLTPANGVLYFVSSGNQLWQTDGTTAELADPSEPSAGWTVEPYAPEPLVGSLDGGLFFLGTDAAHGAEPWLLTAGSAVPPPPASLLVPTLGKTNLPSEVAAGSKLNASVPVVITNSGTPLKGWVTIDLYADTGTDLDGGQFLVASEKRRILLRGSRKTIFNFSVKTLPNSLPDGSYHLIAQVTDPSGGVNSIATSQTLQVLAPIVQPAVSITTITPESNIPGRSESVAITVTNQGNAASTGGQITLALQASNTGVLTDVTLDETRPGLIIPAGKSHRFRLHFKLPSTVPAGTYFPQALVSLNGVSATAVSSLPLTVS
jgi:ELWxxDGT repeat protein